MKIIFSSIILLALGAEISWAGSEIFKYSSLYGPSIAEVSPNGNWILTRSLNSPAIPFWFSPTRGPYVILDRKTGAPVKTIDSDEAVNSELKFTPDSAYVLTTTFKEKNQASSLSPGVRAYDVSTGQVAKTFSLEPSAGNLYRANSEAQYSTEISSDGKLLVTTHRQNLSGNDSTFDLSIWDFNKVQLLKMIPIPVRSEYKYGNTVFSADSKYLAISMDYDKGDSSPTSATIDVYIYSTVDWSLVQKLTINNYGSFWDTRVVFVNSQNDFALLQRANLGFFHIGQTKPYKSFYSSGISYANGKDLLVYRHGKWVGSYAVDGSGNELFALGGPDLHQLEIVTGQTPDGRYLLSYTPFPLGNNQSMLYLRDLQKGGAIERFSIAKCRRSENCQPLPFYYSNDKAGYDPLVYLYEQGFPFSPQSSTETQSIWAEIFRN